MTVTELIEALSECDPNAEVLLATQPEYPLAFRIANLNTAADIAAESGEEPEVMEPCPEHNDPDCMICDGGREEPANIVWIAAGNHPDYPYAPRAAWTN